MLTIKNKLIKKKKNILNLNTDKTIKINKLPLKIKTNSSTLF